MAKDTFWAHARDHVEDLAFTAYVIHEEELNEIVDRICAGELHILTNGWLTSDDLLYIEREVEKRLGVPCDLSL